MDTGPDTASPPESNGMAAVRYGRLKEEVEDSTEGPAVEMAAAYPGGGPEAGIKTEETDLTEETGPQEEEEGKCTLRVTGLVGLKTKEQKMAFLSKLGGKPSICGDEVVLFLSYPSPEEASAAYDNVLEVVAELDLPEEEKADVKVTYCDGPDERCKPQAEEETYEEEGEGEERGEAEGEEDAYSQEPPPEHYHKLLEHKKGPADVLEGLGYSAPTADAIANIGYELWTHPAFFVKVLNLMENMDLPNPFRSGPVKAFTNEIGEEVTHFVKVFKVAPHCQTGSELGPKSPGHVIAGSPFDAALRNRLDRSSTSSSYSDVSFQSGSGLSRKPTGPPGPLLEPPHFARPILGPGPQGPPGPPGPLMPMNPRQRLMESMNSARMALMSSPPGVSGPRFGPRGGNMNMIRRPIFRPNDEGAMPGKNRNFGPRSLGGPGGFMGVNSGLRPQGPGGGKKGKQKHRAGKKVAEREMAKRKRPTGNGGGGKKMNPGSNAPIAGGMEVPPHQQPKIDFSADDPMGDGFTMV